MAEAICLGGGFGTMGGGNEEGALGIMAELMHENPEAAGGIAELGRGFGRGQAVHNEGPERFILALGGVGGLQKTIGERG